MPGIGGVTISPLINLGARGIALKNIPSDVAVSWVDDYASLTWTDTNFGTNYYEIYESKDGGSTYTYLGKTAKGASSYNAYTWQGIDVYLKIKARGGDFADAVHLNSPFVVTTDQTAPETLTMYNAWTWISGGTINVDWGDGSNNDYNSGDTPSHEYTVAGTYCIQVKNGTGNVNSIRNFFWRGHGAKVYGDLSKWVFPMESQYTQSWNFQDTNFTGDLSYWELNSTANYLYLRNTLITGIPKGNLSGLVLLDLRNCPVSKEGLESWYNYAYSYYSSNTPTKNTSFYFDGDRQGPTLSTDTNASGINTLFTAAGFTATIYWNLNSIAWGEYDTKTLVDSVIPYTDPSDGMVHPSVINIGFDWYGYQYWMANTPYPDSAIENPSIYASHDGLTWEVPDGVTNPVVSAPTTGYNADNDIFFENGVMYIIYKYTNGSINELYITYSSDGCINWSTPVKIWGGDSQWVTCPCIIKNGNKYYIYYHNSGGNPSEDFQIISSENILSGYTQESDITIPKKNTTGWWHYDFMIINDVIYFVGVALRHIYIAKSTDGTTFTVDSWIEYSDKYFTPYDDTAYRPTFMILDSGQPILYYSAYSDGGTIPVTVRQYFNFI